MLKSLKIKTIVLLFVPIRILSRIYFKGQNKEENFDLIILTYEINTNNKFIKYVQFNSLPKLFYGYFLKFKKISELFPHTDICSIV